MTPEPPPSPVEPALIPKPVDPKPVARSGGCLMVFLAIVCGTFFVSSVASIPFVLLLGTKGMGEGMRWGIAGGCALQGAFWWYAARGAWRSYRGEADAHLIPPRLLRPVAAVVGVLFSIGGVVGVVFGQPRLLRALGFGLGLVAFAFWPQKKQGMDPPM